MDHIGAPVLVLSAKKLPPDAPINITFPLLMTGEDVMLPPRLTLHTGATV